MRSLPIRVLERIERTARLSQGKGWGTATVAEEVRAGLSLLADPAHGPPVALDVGADVGDWTEAWLAMATGGRVVAFEPSIATHSKLAARFAGHPEVTIVRAAAGKTNQTAVLWADQAGSGLGSLTRRRLDHIKLGFSHSEEVEVVSLDAWCEERGVLPDLIKIDVEGHELDVLAGASRVLGSVSVVQFEFGGCNIDTRTYFQDFFYFFRDRGFDLYRLGPKGLRPVPRYNEQDEAFQTTNYFAVRRRIAP